MTKKERPIPEQGQEPRSIKTEKLPPSFKMGRDVALQLSRVEGDLFTEMEKNENEGENGKYITSGISRVVSELDFRGFSFAVCQILYNQSVQYGNTDTNSGLTREEAPRATKKTGSTQYIGDIVTSLNDLCRLAYGVDAPDARQKKSMSTLLKTIDNTPVVTYLPNGDVLETKLCATMSRYTREEDKAVFYHLHLHSVFCSDVKNNYGELPQDITKRLSKVTKKKTAAHYNLLLLLSLQTKNKPFVRTIKQLLKDLNLDEAHKKDKGRTERQLVSLFECMKNMKMIDRYKIEYTTTRAKKVIDKVTFHLSSREKLLGKSGEEPEEELAPGAC